MIVAVRISHGRQKVMRNYWVFSLFPIGYIEVIAIDSHSSVGYRCNMYNVSNTKPS